MKKLKYTIIESYHVYSLYATNFIITFREFCNSNYRNQFVTQYITYLNIWGALSRNFSSLSTHDRRLWFGLLVRADLLPSTGFQMNLGT